MGKLTALQVRNAQTKERPYKLSDGHGLYFHVAKSGKKTWRYRYKIAGTESTYVIGSYPKISLEDARKARQEARELVKAGKNPASKRREEKQIVIEEERAKNQSKRDSFESLAQEWVTLQRERWSKSHSDHVLATLQHDAFPSIGHLPIDNISPPQILEIIRSIESRGALEIARKVLQRMSSVFRYAIQTGRATYNPAADMQGVLKPKKRVHHAAISREDLPQMLKDISAGDIHINTKLALQFLILTAARTDEVRGATWNEIDWENNIWRVPAERMKMSSQHNVPLSKQALAILQRLKVLYGGQGIIFPGIRQGSKQLSANTMLYGLYRLGYHSKATVHGFRATFSTIANESGFNGDVIEKALAHEERNKIRAAYHRSEYMEQRRELMQWWADLLQQLEYGAEIIPIGQQANK